MKKIWVNKADSFKSAEKFDIEYYLEMSSSERLDSMQFLRELNFKIQRGLKNEISKRLFRFYKVIK